MNKGNRMERRNMIGRSGTWEKQKRQDSISEISCCYPKLPEATRELPEPGSRGLGYLHLKCYFFFFGSSSTTRLSYPNVILRQTENGRECKHLIRREWSSS